MGATFGRIKNWITEILSNTDLNAEIDNILNNLNPSGVDDYSLTVAQMKIQTSPGSLGAESLATSLAGEIERLRYVIQRIMGTSTSFWYQAPNSTITDLVAAIGTGLPTNRIVSGATLSGSSQMCALIPSGTTTSITLSASTTPFVYYVNGVQYSITADVTLSGLGTASTTNNTCRISDVNATSTEQWTKFWGQYGTVINVDGMGSGIAALTGSFAGFKYGAEYFMAYVNSTTQLTNAWRGCFFNQTPSAVAAVGINYNTTMSLMRAAWLFATTTGSIAITYNNPTVSGNQPGTPATGDYWFDLSSTAWKTYNSVTWIASNATLIGMSLQDTTACVAARTFDSFKATSELNTLTLERISNSIVQAKYPRAQISVFGSTSRFEISKPSWDLTQHLDTGLSKSANSTYYLYIKESGAPLISDVAPSDRRDLSGLYYPTNTWRCVGSVVSDASTNFTTPVKSFKPDPQAIFTMGKLAAYINDTVSTVNYPHTAAFNDYFLQKYGEPNSVFTGAVAAGGSWGDVDSITVPIGLWKITGFIDIYNNATPDASNIYTGIGILSGNNSPILVQNAAALPSQAQSHANIQAAPYYVQVETGATVYYLKGKLDAHSASAATRMNSYLILAERIDSLIGVPS